MEFSETVTTGAGMFALWSPAAFRGVVDYATWTGELLEDEDITRHIRSGTIVPINIHSDGRFQFLVRLGFDFRLAGLTARERQFLVAVSDPYLFVATDGAILSGIEHAGAIPGTPAGTRFHLPVPPGRWQVTVTIVDWTAESGMCDARGDPLPGALPDFTILVNPEKHPVPYRTRVETFDRR
ncbi:hypothetical protein [Actinoplanes siamensis]|uniref:Uncharacterized protein n=1 Tax=Actinoplanes siamensis TaxID=1223317 RepID=A0A919K7U5_9ACTN|nr:hypothetical protein [Actinoplanes siamensis]GIF02556.1 hypothetical protein Asi03nite_00940 [Actinoplanes siamensis]